LFCWGFMENKIIECPNCGLTNPTTAIRCDCGYDFVSKELKQSNAIKKPTPPTHSLEPQHESGGFLSFENMISPMLIKTIYFLCAIGITVFCIVWILKGVSKENLDIKQILTGVGMLVLGNIVWRILCETCILAFSIHDTLVSIKILLSKNSVT